MRSFKRPMLSLTIPEDIPSLTINEMIEKTFHVFPNDTPLVIQSKNKMQQIAQTIANEIQMTIQNDIKNNIMPVSRLSPLSVQHRQNDVLKQNIVFDKRLGEPYVIDVYPPIAKIYEIIDMDNVLIKELTIKPNSMSNDASKFLIIRELTFQIYANEISDRCNVVVPQILGRNFYINNKGYLVCEIMMPYLKRVPQQNLIEWIDQMSVEKKTEEIMKLINNVKITFECLRAHAIYHNDSHSDNVFFIFWGNNELRLCVIDFGKTTCSRVLPSTTGLVENSEDTDTGEIIEEFKIWANLMNSNSDLIKIYKENNKNKYGGILSKKTKRHKQSKRYKQSKRHKQSKRYNKCRKSKRK